MTTATAEFFEALARRGREPLLGKARGTIRVDLVDDGGTDHWLLAVDRGAVSVSRADEAADFTLRANRKVFDRMARGEANTMAMLLRGEVEADGRWELGVAFQRLFPGPPATSGRRAGRTEQ
jgi:putative sterol carrier protein